ncbi:hypothetical protein F6Y03_00105 [Bacillus megaterium]|nr:hypothetical protein [Priestia megaterium]
MNATGAGKISDTAVVSTSETTTVNEPDVFPGFKVTVPAEIVTLDSFVVINAIFDIVSVFTKVPGAAAVSQSIALDAWSSIDNFGSIVYLPATAS